MQLFEVVHLEHEVGQPLLVFQEPLINLLLVICHVDVGLHVVCEGIELLFGL